MNIIKMVDIDSRKIVPPQWWFIFLPWRWIHFIVYKERKLNPVYTEENPKPKMKPYVLKSEDGSITVEWIHKDCRFAINIEKDPKESSWYFVAKEPKSWKERSFIMEGDLLPPDVLELFKKEEDREKN